ncbi:MAG: hypothetical protein HKN17_10655 [Rhodothermales bacterium]|nr:hypothetical protein [Rhodothermales bacterium]
MTAFPGIPSPRWIALSCVVVACALLRVPGAEARQGVPAPQFDRFSVEEGLSQSSVFALRQDSHGFLWVGTTGGLNRFDGTRFLTLGRAPLDTVRLSHDWIMALHEDAGRRLWIGTHGGGLNVLDLQTAEVRVYRADDGDPTSLPHDIVTDIVSTPEGTIWVSTYGGLARFDPDSARFDVWREESERAGSLPENNVLDLEVDSAGNLWLGTDLAGLYRFDAESEIFERVELVRSGSAGPADVILTLYAEPGGTLWAGTAGRGLFRVDSESGDVRRFGSADPGSPESRILSITRDAAGALRIGTDGGGIGVVDEETGRIRMSPESLTHDVVEALLVDRTGQLWVGTTGGGLNRERRFDHLGTRTTPATASDHILALYEDRSGRLWIGSEGGLDRIDLSTGERMHYHTGSRPALASDRVMDIDPLLDGRLLLSTGGGLQVLDPGSGIVEGWTATAPVDEGLRDNRIITSAPSVSTPGRMWVGTWNGLHAMDLSTGSFEQIRHDPMDPASLSNNRIFALLEASDGTLWVGTMAGGLNRRRPDGSGFDRFAHAQGDSSSLSNDIVTLIHEGADGTIWVGTADGLNRFLPGRQAFRRYTTANGLPDNTIYGMTEDDAGRLWLSTNQGLAVLRPDDSAVFTFDVSDGLQSNEFNHGAVHRSDNGTMLFGGIAGVNRFHPDVVLPLTEPPVELTALATARRTWNPLVLPALDRIEMRPEDGALSFEFAALDFRNPAGNTYEVMLEGEDNAPQLRTADQRFGSYARLDGGDYRLRIGAASSTGVWNHEGVTIDLSVVPPFWATTWFRLLAALAILMAFSAVGLMLHRRRMREIEAERREEQEIHRRLMDSREAERLHLAQELHDGAVQDLYGIRFRLGAGPDGAESTPPASAGDGAPGSPASEMVQEVITKLRQICGELRPPVLTPFGLERTLRSHADTVRERYPDLEIRLDLDADGQTLPEPVRIALFRVVQESINNVVKHAEATCVTVRLRLEGSSVDLSVEDDGKGFTPPRSWLELGRKDHFGLLGLSERVRAIGGRLDVRSAPGRGTNIHVHVPDVQIMSKET